MTPELPEPREDVDYFSMDRIKYRLLVGSYVYVEEDEEFDDWLSIINPAGTKDKQGSIDDIMVIEKTVLRSEERRIDDPTKPFDREAWVQAKREELGIKENGRPKTELTLGNF